jgi:diguanylate cyclase (GGDEF)-like protein/PAS domain S-box-containing protein
LRHYDAAEFDAAAQSATGTYEGTAGAALQAAELQLAESRRQFDSLLRALSGIFYRCQLAPPWTMTFISDGAETLTGYSAQEIEQMDGWADLILPNDLAAVQKAAERAIAANESFAITYRIVDKSGDVKWVSEQSHAVCDEQGRPLFLEGVITDVSGRKQAEELQRTLAGRWRKTLDTIPQMVWSMSADGSDEFFNVQWMEFAGQKVGRAHGLPRTALIHPDDRERALQSWERSLATGEAYEAEYRLRHHCGEYRWVLSRGCAERDPRGKLIRWYGSCTDIHDRVAAQEQLVSQQSFVRKLIGATPDSIVLLDQNGVVLFANDNAMAGLASGGSTEVAGRRWTDLVPGRFRRDARAAFLKSRATGLATQFTGRLGDDDEKWWDVIVTPVTEGDHQVRLLVTSRDITHQKRVENQARWSASHDSLTQLPNRSVLQQRLASLTVPGARRPFALLLMDVDEFKRINDSLGHDAGDALLCTFAKRLRRVVRPEDLVARLGGDEFAIVVMGLDSEQDLAAFADKLFEALREPCLHEGKLLECRASIGASLFPIHGSDPGELLKASDLALYGAKGAGRGTIKLFENGMRAERQRRNSMISLAKRALGENLIVPHYQPKVELTSGKVAGFEALLRWRHPRNGLQMPDSIKAAFEDPNLAAEISDRMIDGVLADVRKWLSADVDFGHVAINSAAAEFRRGHFAERLLERMDKADIPRRCIQLEVTETVFLGRGAEYVERALQTLSAAGVAIALDDFGTGFASLSHLKQFPVHIIKIDRSFVRDLQLDGGDGAIVDAVVSLGKSLRIDVVAEGIETQAQHDTLLALGCRYGQGFLYGKAEPAGLVEAMLKGGAPAATRALS